jgi:hypothetical protein
MPRSSVPLRGGCVARATDRIVAIATLAQQGLGLRSAIGPAGRAPLDPLVRSCF